MDQIVSELQKVGFSQYEAQAYVALLQYSPVTGYELSKRSGVPRSMIYEVVGKLLDRGAAYVIPAEPTTYAPVPAKEVIMRLRHNAEETFTTLEGSLTALESPAEVETIKHIRGYDPVLAEMTALIEHAQKELWLSFWSANVSVFDAQKGGGIGILCVHLNEEGDDGLQDGIKLFREHLPPRELHESEQRQQSHLHIAIRDTEEVIIANFLKGSRPWAIKTQDKALVFLATELVQRSILLGVLNNEVGTDHVREICRQHPALKNLADREWSSRSR